MNIALVIERMDVTRGGRETSTAQIAAGLARRGHEATILCQRGSWEHDGVTVRPLGSRSLGRFVADVQAVIASGEFDIVHTMLPIPGANVYQPRGGTVPGNLVAKRRMRGPVLAPLASLSNLLNPRRRLTARLEQQVVDDPNTLCLANSEMVAREFQDLYRRRDGVRVVYNGVDGPDVDDETRADWRQERRFRMGATQRDVVFLSVAKNYPLKGMDYLIRAFAKWRSRTSEPKAHLVCLGGDVVEGYRRLASLNGVGPHVHFIPPVDDAFPWYAAADAVVLLSWYDACSRVVLEAVRWGIPAITTTFNGAAEALASGAGLVVESPRDLPGVVATLDRMAAPEARTACTTACREIADTLSMDRHVDDLLDTYHVLRSRNRS